MSKRIAVGKSGVESEGLTEKKRIQMTVGDNAKDLPVSPNVRLRRGQRWRRDG
jgi:hypothetical protein